MIKKTINVDDQPKSIKHKKPHQIQKEYFSKDKSAAISIDTKEMEDYIDKVEKNYHKRRKEDWWENYKIYRRNTAPNQVAQRKNQLD